MAHGWNEKSLGELVQDITNLRLVNISSDDIVTEPTIKSKTHVIEVASIKLGINVKITKRVRLMPGDLVFSRLHSQNGAFAYCNREFLATTTFIPLAVNENIVDRRFLYWALHVRVPSLATSDSVGRETYRTPDILRLKISLPSMEEQVRIVRRIEEMLAKVSEAMSLRERAVEETEEMLFSYSRTAFSEIKKTFSPVTFGSFSPHVTSGPRYWSARYSNSGARFYRAQDITSDFRISSENKVYVEPPETNLGKTAFLENGDLMIVITGATVGRCSVYSRDLEPGYVSQHVAICRLPSKKVSPQYALWWLRSPDGQNQLLGQRYGQGKPGLNLTNIRSISIPVPLLDEQRHIVAHLDAVQAKVDELRRLQAETREKLRALMPSILDRAFKGEL
jgi:type I restriction enzyme S subunit